MVRSSSGVVDDAVEAVPREVAARSRGSPARAAAACVAADGRVASRRRERSSTSAAQRDAEHQRDARPAARPAQPSLTPCRVRTATLPKSAAAAARD